MNSRFEASKRINLFDVTAGLNQEGFKYRKILFPLFYCCGFFFSHPSHAHYKDTITVEMYLEQSSYFLLKRGEARENIDSSLFYSQKALDLSKTLNFLRGTTEALFLIGKAYIKSHLNRDVDSVIQKADIFVAVRLMLEFISYNTTYEGSDEQVLRTAREYATKSLQITGTQNMPGLHAQALLQFANVEYIQHSPNIGKIYFLKATEAAQKAGDLEGEAEIFSQMTTYLKLDADPSLISNLEECGKNVLEGYRKIAHKKEKAAIQRLLIIGYDQLSFHYLYHANLDFAYARTLEMVRLLESENNPFLNEVPYQTLGKICLELGRPQESIEYVRKAYTIVEKKGEILDGSALKTIIKAYIQSNQPKEALRFLESLIRRGGYDDLRSRKLISESTGNAYFAMKQYDKAEKYYLDSYEKGKQLGREQVFVASLPLGRLYVTTRQYNKARPYLVALIDSGSKTVPLFTKRDANWLLFQADSATEDFISAIAHLKQYKSLNDSIFNERRNGQIEALKLGYETEKKDRDLEILYKHSQLQEAALRQSKFVKNVYIVGLIVLFLLFGMVYNRYRFRIKTTRLLEEKQSEINQQNLRLTRNNEALQKLIFEKEWLVREIHHRVKNNMQIIISLFNAQTEYTDNPSVIQAIREGQERMQAIALLHQSLYGPERGGTIAMDSYIPDMVYNVERSFTNNSLVQFQLDIDPVELDISQAVPVGLILNETIANSLKYAFTKKQRGIIKISLKISGRDKLRLTISDNGVGIPDFIAKSNRQSLGMQLIHLFSEQLEGELTIKNVAGTEISLVFAPRRLHSNLNPTRAEESF